MKITLLGAGHIGQTIARLLGASGDYEVTVSAATALPRSLRFAVNRELGGSP